MSGALLTFDAPAHRYTLPSGAIVPSVTTILRAVGVSTDFDAVRAASRDPEAIDRKRDLGTVVHADCHAWDDGDLDETTVDPRVRPYLDAWSAFRHWHQDLMPIAREHQVYHPALGYAGTLDGIFRHRATGRHVLVDLKTGDPARAAAYLQTAAYELAWQIDHPEIAIAERWSVELCPGRTIPYRVVNYSAWPDAWTHAEKFRACVTVFYEQPGRRA